MFKGMKKYLSPDELGANVLETAEPTNEIVDTENDSVETVEDETSRSTVDMSMEEVIEMQRQKAKKEAETVETEVVEEKTKDVQSKEDNSKYAAARREAESEIKKRDAEIAERYKGYVNPKTGAPITNQKELFEAQDAQREIQSQQVMQEATQKLQQSGADMNLINQLIQNSPEMQNLKQLQFQMEQYQREQNQKIVDENIQSSLKEIAKYDDSIKTLDDIDKLDKVQEIIQYVKSDMSLDQAYKQAYFDEILEKNKSKAKQSAVTQIKSKAHLQTTQSYSGEGDDIRVPESTMNMLREMYPDAKDAELRKKAARHVNN